MEVIIFLVIIFCELELICVNGKVVCKMKELNWFDNLGKCYFLFYWLGYRSLVVYKGVNFI